MRHTMLLALAWVGLGLGLAGCASTGGPGTSSDWSSRVPELVRETESSPQDAGAWTRLGIAYEAAGREDEAVDALARALVLAPESAEAGLPLAQILLDRGALDRAEQVLSTLQPLTPDDAGLVRSARRRLERDRLAVRMRELARQESSLPARDVPEETLGVLDFPLVEAQEPAGRTGRPEEPVRGEDTRYDGLGKALSAVLTTELSRLPEVRVLERQNLHVLLAEIRLMEEQRERRPEQPTLDPVDSLRGVQQRLALLRPNPGAPPFYEGAADGLPGPSTTRAIRDFQSSRGLVADGIAGPRTAAALDEAVALLFEDPAISPAREPAVRPEPKAGRLLGARRLLGGDIAVRGDETISVRSHVVDAVDGAILSEEDIEAPVEEFHRVPGEIVLRTAADLDIPIDEETRRRLENLPPVTRSLAAFLAFGRGLEYEDRGLWREASAEYEAALRLAPEFELAQERVEVVRLGSAAFQQSLQRTMQVAARAARVSSVAAASALGSVGAGTQEDAARDDSSDPSRAVQTDGPPLGTVRVSGQVPVR